MSLVICIDNVLVLLSNTRHVIIEKNPLEVAPRYCLKKMKIFTAIGKIREREREREIDR